MNRIGIHGSLYSPMTYTPWPGEAIDINTYFAEDKYDKVKKSVERIVKNSPPTDRHAMGIAFEAGQKAYKQSWSSDASPSVRVEAAKCAQQAFLSLRNHALDAGQQPSSAATVAYAAACQRLARLTDNSRAYRRLGYDSINTVPNLAGAWLALRNGLADGWLWTPALPASVLLPQETNYLSPNLPASDAFVMRLY